jgi:hypothetical protein
VLGQRIAHDRSDEPACGGFPKVPGELQLHATSAPTPVADIEGIEARINVPLGARRKARGVQSGRKPCPQLDIESADVDLRFAFASVHGQRDEALGNQREAARMVEFVTGDMQAAVLCRARAMRAASCDVPISMPPPWGAMISTGDPGRSTARTR